MKRPLHSGEIWVLLAMLYKGGRATVEEVEKITGLSTRYLRNVFSELRKLGYITSFRGSIRLMTPSTPTEVLYSSARDKMKKEAIYTLTKDSERILEEHPEILIWCKITLNANSLNEAFKKIEEEIKERETIKSSSLLQLSKEERLKFVEENIEMSTAIAGFTVSEEELHEFLSKLKERKEKEQ